MSDPDLFDEARKELLEEGFLAFMQNQKNHGSVVALLSGKFLQIRKVIATRHIFCQNCPVGKETVRMVRKLSGKSTTVRTI